MRGADLEGQIETKRVSRQQIDAEGGKLHDVSNAAPQNVGDLAARNWLLGKGQRKTLKLLKRIRSPDGYLHRAGLAMILTKLEVQDPEPLLDRLHELSDVPIASTGLVSQTAFLKWVGFEVDE